MTKNSNKIKNTIDKVGFFTLFIRACAYSKTQGGIFVSHHCFFCFFYVKHLKKQKIPWRQYYELYEKTAVNLSSIQCCIMCANDTRSGPLLKKLLDFITFETSE